MRRKLALISAVTFLLFCIGCAGTNYVHHENVAGYDVIQGGRTGIIGTDNSFVYIAPPKVAQPLAVSVQAPVVSASVAPMAIMSASAPVTSSTVIQKNPVKIKLEKSYTRSSTSWTGCPDKTPNRNAKNVQREEVSETWTDDVISEEISTKIIETAAPVITAPASPAVVMTPVQQPAAFWAGGNPSVGNFTAPALAIAGGMIGLRPNRSNVESNSNSEINHSGNSGSGKHGHE
jgi:hypothetical protein